MNKQNSKLHPITASKTKPEEHNSRKKKTTPNKTTADNTFFKLCIVFYFKAKLFLQHSSDEFVDVLLSVSVVATNDVVVSLLVEATERRAELERPEEVVSLLEVRADGVNLVDQVLHARDAVLAEGFLNLAVAAETDALTVDAPEATLVAQHADRLQVRVAPSDVGLNLLEHVERSLVEADEGTVVDLSQAEELENLTALRGNTEDALKSKRKTS